MIDLVLCGRVVFSVKDKEKFLEIREKAHGFTTGRKFLFFFL